VCLWGKHGRQVSSRSGRGGGSRRGSPYSSSLLNSFANTELDQTNPHPSGEGRGAVWLDFHSSKQVGATRVVVVVVRGKDEANINHVMRLMLVSNSTPMQNNWHQS